MATKQFWSKGLAQRGSRLLPLTGVPLTYTKATSPFFHQSAPPHSLHACWCRGKCCKADDSQPQFFQNMTYKMHGPLCLITTFIRTAHTRSQWLSLPSQNPSHSPPRCAQPWRLSQPVSGYLT